MLCYAFDEMSHWATVVKTMTIYNKLSCFPNMNLMFQNYPPAMALVQYFLQKINSVIYGSNCFIDWHTYFIYDLFYISFAFPVIFKIKNKFLFIVSLLIIPFYFNSEYLYKTLLIDPFVGFVAAFGFIINFNYDHDDYYYYLYECTLLFVLTLSKDVGLLFAIFISMYSLYITFKSNKNKIIYAILIVISVLFAKLSWSLLLNINNSNIAFGSKIDLFQSLNIIFNNDNSYKTEVFHLYFNRLLCGETSFIIPLLRVSIPYSAFLLIILFLLFFLSSRMEKKEEFRIMNMVLCIEAIVYSLGLSLVYCFKFSEYEALILASFDRYLSMLIIQLVLILISYYFVIELKRTTKILIKILIVIFCIYIFYGIDLKRVVKRDYITKSHNRRDCFTNINLKVNDICDDNDKLFLVSEGDGGYNINAMNFLFKPIVVDNGIMPFNYNVNYFTGEKTNIDISPDELMNFLIENGYDYVLIFRTDDLFNEKYHSIFNEDSNIEDECLYSIDANEKKLIFVK